MSVQRSAAPTVPFRLSGHVTNSGACPKLVELFADLAAMSSLLTVSMMSKFTVPPLTLLTVTLTPSFCPLVVRGQSSVDSGLRIVGAGHRVGVLPGLLGDLRTDLVGDFTLGHDGGGPGRRRYPRVQGNA